MLRRSCAAATTKLAIATLLLLLAACSTRSISNAGYPGDPAARNPLYAGELREVDVIGWPAREQLDDAAIAAELASSRPVALRRQQPLLVIQSGALLPDAPMLEALRAHFDVAPFSGIPLRGANDDTSYSRQLRLSAARGGYPTILCYWGTLESAREDQVTKAVSWVPIAGWVLPDEVQHMRINLKALLVDVASGRWRMVAVDSFADSGFSAIINRRSADQNQVELLKRQAYEALARKLAAFSEAGVGS